MPRRRHTEQPPYRTSVLIGDALGGGNLMNTEPRVELTSLSYPSPSFRRTLWLGGTSARTSHRTFSDHSPARASNASEHPF